MERRFNPAGIALEQRVGTDLPFIVGYAAVYYDKSDPGTEYELWNYDGGRDRCVERIMPGAFSDFLVPQIADGIDCCALYNHNPDHLLGRQSAGTLTLTSDARGLKYSITPPDSPLAQGVIANIKRGDLRGSSFSFMVERDGCKWISQGGQSVREIHRVSALLDVGPVTFPAYASTTTGTRSLVIPSAHIEEARAQFLTWQRGTNGQHERDRMRLRLADAND